MTERNGRDVRERRAGSTSQRRREPEMSLHDSRGRARVERTEPRSRAVYESPQRRERAYEADRRLAPRRYEEEIRPSRRYDDRRRPPVRRRKKRGGCLSRTLLIAFAGAVLLLAGIVTAETLVDRIRVKVHEEYCPVKYEDLIRTYAAQNSLEPAHVAAVIMTESSYNPQALSNVGARGLMQLMPNTANWIAGKLGEQITEDQLFDPETNIRFGCYYLAFLMERYNDDLTCVSAAYHAGHGTVDKWLKNEEYSPDGETLAVIASDVTNTYVSRILRRYEKYTEIYAEEP